MYKKNLRKGEPEHRRLDIKPEDRGDHSGRRIIKIPKNKTDNENQQLKLVDTKKVCDTLRKQIQTKDLGECFVKVEEERVDDSGDAGKMPLLAKKLDETVPRKVAQSKYMMMLANNPYGIRLSEKNVRKIQEKMQKEVKPLDIDKRRKLHRMYTFRTPSDDSNVVKGEKSEKVDTDNTAPPPLFHIRQEVIEENLREESQLDDSSSEDTRTPRTSCSDHRINEGVQTDVERARKQEAHSTKTQIKATPKNRKQSPTRHKRKPIIRTLMTRKGDSTKIYKAVSFVDQKKKAPLKIEMANRFSRTLKTPITPRTSRTPRTPQTPRTPNTPSPTYSQKSKHKTSSPSSTHSNPPSMKLAKHKTSPSNINKLILNRKCKGKSRSVRNPSPETAVAPPPVTEVAKWAPLSVNEHTKPYYEAWVNTTLTAISSDNEKIRREKQRIIQQMQERLEFQNAFGSEQDLSDEKYTGRIKVTTHR